MKKSVALLTLMLVSSAAFGQKPSEDELVPFTWGYKEAVYARIRVPPGFEDETEKYVEGMFTYLRYPDGSYIVLHRGTMVRIPLLDGPEYETTSTKEDLDERKNRRHRIRRGRVRQTELYWREENLSFGWPRVNIAFDRVPKDRLDLFNKSLDSFVGSYRSVPPNKSTSRTRN